MEKNSEELLKEIEMEKKKNREVAAELARKENKVYQDLAIAAIKKAFKVRDDLKKPYETFCSVNSALSELETLYPGYLSFLQKSDFRDCGFDPAQVKYLIDYLLTSKWNKDGDFFQVLNRICETMNVPSNPFREVNNDG